MDYHNKENSVLDLRFMKRNLRSKPVPLRFSLSTYVYTEISKYTNLSVYDMCLLGCMCVILYVLPLLAVSAFNIVHIKHIKSVAVHHDTTNKCIWCSV